MRVLKWILEDNPQSCTYMRMRRWDAMIFGNAATGDGRSYHDNEQTHKWINK